MPPEPMPEPMPMPPETMPQPPEPVAMETVCFDGIDNDRDGNTDCIDTDCDGERTTINGIEFECGSNEFICDDGADNDRDGMADCFDSDCENIAPCENLSELTCDDGFDNDADGMHDCADEDCDGRQGISLGGLCEFGAEANCTDNFDNDADDLIDCEDEDCLNICSCGGDGRCTVFITSNTYNGGLIVQAQNSPINASVSTGTEAGDAICQFHADNATPRLMGRYRAWLNDGVVSADRDPDFTRASLPYFLTNGTQVANSFSNFERGGVLLNPANIDENGNGIAVGDRFPWTGITLIESNSIESIPNCSGWSSGEFEERGLTGDSIEVLNSEWSNARTVVRCNAANRLYCFEQ